MTDAISIRDFATQADYAACVALQRDIWGRDFNDSVPASVQQIAQKLGGVAAGAFDATGRLVGFVFGMTGVENGVVVHWSDMLAVRPEAQNLGVGRRLKDYQRRKVARVGARVIYWTYDPLVARNAHLNFNVFGVRVVEYVRDMYGHDTGSVLHRGIGTDRLIVAWPVDDGQITERLRETSAAREAGEHAATIAVPADIAEVMHTNPARAVEWRNATRREFEAALARGYRVDGFRMDPSGQRGLYLLSRP